LFREILKFPDGPSVAVAAADAFIDSARALLKAKHEIHVSITGGTVGILTLAKIAEHPGCEALDWANIHLWWGDDRFVPVGHPDSNAKQAQDALLGSLLFLNPANVHAFPSYQPELEESIDEQLDNARDAFAAEVERFIAPGASQPYFDITLLGMGPDGHIASLFPGHAAPPTGVSVIAEHNSPKPPPQRLSFTYEAINNSGEIWFVVAGADKAEAVSVAFSDAPDRLPVGRVHGLTKTVWFIDDAAAAGIA
jgi:6-phosphogluconolactonase